ncbi:MAG: hypothetical protein AB7O74_16170 [Candidatus Nanopelagicales bacterium]
MATTTAPLHVVPAATAVAAPRRTWIAPAVAGLVGGAAAVLGTWWIVASQSLEMTMRTAGF